MIYLSKDSIARYMITLDGKVCLITGSVKGIAVETALMMPKAGAKVFISDIYEKSAIIVFNKLIKKGGDAFFFK